jgi:DNA-binding response OmpR family regulator
MSDGPSGTLAPSVLVASDDPSLGESVTSGLRLRGMRASWMRGTPGALRYEFAAPYDALVLDVGLPFSVFCEFLSFARAATPVTPLLFLTVDGALPDDILDMGRAASDFCVKPVDLNELEMRLRMLLRAVQQVQPSGTLTLHGVVLDPADRTVSVDGASVSLSGREFELLQIFLLNVGRVLSREQLGNQLYRWGAAVESNAVEVHVHHLRRKLHPALIVTVRGAGYVLPREIKAG